MTITHLLTNHMEDPIGFMMDEIRFSCVVEASKGKKAVSARYQVSVSRGFEAPFYDSGELSGDIDLACFVLPATVEARTGYYWRVWVKSDAGEEAWSEPASFETPRGDSEPWTADFIAPDWEGGAHPVIFRDLTVGKRVKRARAYMLGIGAYELMLDGEKVGDEVLLPGLHDYDSWLQYQTFALELSEGTHRIEVLLGNGWYKGPYGLKSRLPRYGDSFGVIGEIELVYEDDTRELIPTDGSWRARRSPITFDAIYDGEHIDPSAADGAVYPVKKCGFPKEKLRPRLSPYIRVQERLKPALIVTPSGETVLDMGQNMTGWVSFRDTLPKGTKVRLQFGEILQNGNFYRENLRTAKAEFVYVSDGEGAEVRPHFTFFGFRYVKVEGWPDDIDPALFTGCVIYSQMERTGEIKFSDAKLQRLFENVVWSQKGNFLDVPTDCPQRDERMGWTGDAQVFSDTACFNMDAYAFYEKFCTDLQYEQAKLGGSVPFVVPTSRYELAGASVWGDAATVIPWQTYLHFADAHILKRQYGSMKAWVDYIRRSEEENGGGRLWKCGRHFGDWLALDGRIPGGVYGRTDPYYIASAFYYYSASLVARTARVLGNADDAEEYQRLAGEILSAIRSEYFTPAGRLAVDTQTGFALAAFMGLVPDGTWGRFKKDFRRRMCDSGMKLETGFAGAPYLLPALSICGCDDIAYALLLREEYPSWLYEVNLGATTIWERWNSVLPDGGMNPEGMNSLNHYAYGSVAAWMYRFMTGVAPNEDAPGFAVIDMCPRISRRLGSVDLTLMTARGVVKSAWSVTGDEWEWCFTVPFGARARVSLPEYCVSPQINGALTLDAGEYGFKGTLVEKNDPLERDWRELLMEQEKRKAIEEVFPAAVRGIAFQNEQYSLGDVANSPFSELPEDKISLLAERLKEEKRL